MRKAKSPKPPKQPEPVHVDELSNIAMVVKNEKKYSTVIDDGEVKQWVCFGWITLRDATDADRATYPAVERSKPRTSTKPRKALCQRLKKE